MLTWKDLDLPLSIASALTDSSMVFSVRLAHIDWRLGDLHFSTLYTSKITTFERLNAACSDLCPTHG